MDLSVYKQCFEKLQAIAYRDIIINGIGIRVLGVHYMDDGPAWKVIKHRHSFFEFHYVAENYTYTAINNTEHKIRAGSFYLMPPGTYHSHRQDPDCGHIGFALRWEFAPKVKQAEKPDSGGLETTRIRDALLCAHSRPVTDDRGISDSMLRLLEMAESDCGVLSLQLEFCQLVIKIAGCYASGVEAGISGINYSFLENSIVDNAIRFMEENYSQDIDVYDISNSVHLSYSHLARLFKEHTNDTINHHLNRIRLGKAQHLLMCSGKSIARVAEEVGFKNEHYFCTAFKKLYSLTPGSYRRGKNILAQ